MFCIVIKQTSICSITEQSAAKRLSERAKSDTTRAKEWDMTQKVRLNSIKDIVARSGLSRSTIYEEMDSGRLQSVKVGSRRLIPESAFIAFIDNLIGTSTNEASDSTTPQGQAPQHQSNPEMAVSR